MSSFVKHLILIILFITKITKPNRLASQDVRLKQSVKPVGQSNGDSVFPSIHGKSASSKPVDFSIKTKNMSVTVRSLYLGGKNLGDSVNLKPVDSSDKSKVNSVHFKPAALGGKNNDKSAYTKPGDLSGRNNGDPFHGKSANVKPVDLSSKTQNKSVTVKLVYLGAKNQGYSVHSKPVGGKSNGDSVHLNPVDLGGRNNDKSVHVQPGNLVGKLSGETVNVKRLNLDSKNNGDSVHVNKVGYCGKSKGNIVKNKSVGLGYKVENNTPIKASKSVSVRPVDLSLHDEWKFQSNGWKKKTSFVTETTTVYNRFSHFEDDIVEDEYVTNSVVEKKDSMDRTMKRKENRKLKAKSKKIILRNGKAKYICAEPDVLTKVNHVEPFGGKDQIKVNSVKPDVGRVVTKGNYVAPYGLRGQAKLRPYGGEVKFVEAHGAKGKTNSHDQDGGMHRTTKSGNFRSRRWGSSLPGLRTRDPLLSPPST